LYNLKKIKFLIFYNILNHLTNLKQNTLLIFWNIFIGNGSISIPFSYSQNSLQLMNISFIRILRCWLLINLLYRFREITINRQRMVRTTTWTMSIIDHHLGLADPARGTGAVIPARASESTGRYFTGIDNFSRALF